VYSPEQLQQANPAKGSHPEIAEEKTSSVDDLPVPLRILFPNSSSDTDLAASVQRPNTTATETVLASPDLGSDAVGDPDGDPVGDPDGTSIGGPGVMVDMEDQLVSLWQPGKIIHIYSHHGVYLASEVPRDFPELRSIGQSNRDHI